MGKGAGSTRQGLEGQRQPHWKGDQQVEVREGEVWVVGAKALRQRLPGWFCFVCAELSSHAMWLTRLKHVIGGVRCPQLCSHYQFWIIFFTPKNPWTP